MAPKVFALLVGFALLAAACGEVGQPTSRPTPDVPMLSEAAAIGLVSQQCDRTLLARLIRTDAKASYQGNRVWRVTVSTGTYSGTWEVYEASATVAPIGENDVQTLCDRGD